MLGLQDLVSSIFEEGFLGFVPNVVSRLFFLKLQKLTRETQMGGGVVVAGRSGQLEIGASLPRSCSVWGGHIYTNRKIKILDWLERMRR